MQFSDTYRTKGLRKSLIQELQVKGIKDSRVLAAMSKLPRHWFLDSGFEEWAYRDLPFAIGCGQTISQPYTVAFQSSLLEISSHQKVLEIGTGSGYQACILHLIGGRVFSIERQKSLYAKTRDLLDDLGFKMIRLLYGDGYLGWPTQGPFDRILVTAGAEDIPSRLVDQLAWGGRLVIPVGDVHHQEMILIHKDRFGRTREENYGRFLFVPFLAGTEEGLT